MLLEAKNISVRYGDHAAVRDVSFSLETGHWLMLVGPNGAGKSSLVNALARTVSYGGAFFLEGRDTREFKPAALARRIGVLSQSHRMEYGFSVEEVVRLGRFAHEKGFLSHRDSEGQAQIQRALALTGLEDMRRASVLSLSGGEMQRVFLAQVFAQDPQVLVLDEPANHLDLKYQQQTFGLIAEWLRQKERAVIAVVHDLSLARRYGTEALLLHRGACAAQGAMDRVFAPEILRPVYEMDVHQWMRDLLEPWQTP